MTRVAELGQRHPVLSDPHGLDLPLSETGRTRNPRHAVTFDAHALFEQLPRDQQRLLVRPVARSTLFVARHDLLFATGAARARGRALGWWGSRIQLGPDEVRLTRIEHS